eukprot:362555-Pelagomonas_calceolata.AAC.2
MARPVEARVTKNGGVRALQTVPHIQNDCVESDLSTQELEFALSCWITVTAYLFTVHEAGNGCCVALCGGTQENNFKAPAQQNRDLAFSKGPARALDRAQLNMWAIEGDQPSSIARWCALLPITDHFSNYSSGAHCALICAQDGHAPPKPGYI